MIGREVRKGRSTQGVRALTKAGSEYARDARVRGRDSLRDTVIAVCHAWSAARREIARGLGSTVRIGGGNSGGMGSVPPGEIRGRPVPRWQGRHQPQCRDT